MANVLQDAAAHRAKLQDALANIAGTINDAGKLYENDRSRWAIEWDDLASIGSEVRVFKKDDQVQFDTNVFGPALKQTTKIGQAMEIKQVLLAKEKDFTDALISIDRDNFLSNPHESIVHDVNLLRTVAAGIYAVNRGLFVGMSPENAMANVHYYRFLIRHLRSQLYLADLISENLERLSERTFNLEVVKEKYEATIFTLRRQLDDYHKAHGAVGKNADGKVVANESSGRNVLHSMIAAATTAANTLDAVNNGGGAAVVLGMTAAENSPAAYVVVQIEELGNLRSRQRQLMDRAMEQCKLIMLTTANGFDARRTNYHEENEKRDSHNLPTCYMFKISDPHNAIAFGIELHNELNSSAEWPKQLLDMKRFGSDTSWRGLRARIGIHLGEASLVESPDGTIVQHYEGVVVDKAMRLASMAVCGECLVSKTLWESYQQALKEGKVPPSKRYQSLRTMVTDRVESGRKRGFRKDEYYLRVWTQALQERKDSKPQDIDVEFGLISFFGLEIGATVEEESDQPTAEDLLQAKDTEITLLQQELDNLRLAIIKRDSDIEDIRKHMFSHIHQLNSQMDAKTFYHENLARNLECQLMKAHDTMSRCSNITAAMATCIGGGKGGASRTTSTKSKSRKSSTGIWGEEEDNGLRDGGEAANGEELQNGSFPDFGEIGDGCTLEDLDKKRQKEFEEWSKENGGVAVLGDGLSSGNTALHRTRSNVSSTDATSGQKKHKNHRLWRELNQLITGATVTSKAQATKPRRSFSGTGGSGRPASAGGATSANPTGKDPTVVQKIHSLVRVYGRLLKRFSQQKNLADVDDQSLSEEQFIQLFLKLTNSDTVGSARETFHLCMQTAIENEDIESANANDDSRLMRSVVGHFVKIFLLFRTFKKRAIVDANLFDEEGNLVRETNEKTRGEAATKQRKGGAKRTSAFAGTSHIQGAVNARLNSAAHSPATVGKGGLGLSTSMRGATPNGLSFASSTRGGETSPAPHPSLNVSGGTRPTMNVTAPNLGGGPQTVTAKQLDNLERHNASLSRELAQRDERLSEAKAKTTRDEETIRNLRDEIRKIRSETEQRVKSAVAAAQASLKDPIPQRETYSTNGTAGALDSSRKANNKKEQQHSAKNGLISGYPLTSPLTGSFTSSNVADLHANSISLGFGTHSIGAGAGGEVGLLSPLHSQLSNSATGRVFTSTHSSPRGEGDAFVRASRMLSGESELTLIKSGRKNAERDGKTKLKQDKRTGSQGGEGHLELASNDVSLRLPESGAGDERPFHPFLSHVESSKASSRGERVPLCFLELLLSCFYNSQSYYPGASHNHMAWKTAVTAPAPPNHDNSTSHQTRKHNPFASAIVSAPIHLRVGGVSEDGSSPLGGYVQQGSSRNSSPRGNVSEGVNERPQSGNSSPRWSSADTSAPRTNRGVFATATSSIGEGTERTTGGKISRTTSSAPPLSARSLPQTFGYSHHSAAGVNPTNSALVQLSLHNSLKMTVPSRRAADRDAAPRSLHIGEDKRSGRSGEPANESAYIFSSAGADELAGTRGPHDASDGWAWEGSKHYMEVSQQAGSVRSVAVHDPSIEGSQASRKDDLDRVIRSAHRDVQQSSADPLVIATNSAYEGAAGRESDKIGSARTPLSPLQAVGLRGQTSSTSQQQFLREQQNHALLLINQRRRSQDSLAAELDSSSLSTKGVLGKVTPSKRLSSSQAGPAYHRRLPNNLYNFSNALEDDFTDQQVIGIGIGPEPELPLAKVTGPPDYIQLALNTSSPSKTVTSNASYQVVKPQAQELSLRRGSDSVLGLSPQLVNQISSLRRSVQTIPQATDDSSRTPTRGAQLHFAMTRAENESILAKAAEEQKAYIDQQQRLQEQLVELRALQQQSLGLLGVRPKGVFRQTTISVSQDTEGPRKEPCLMEITRITPKPKGRGSISSANSLPSLTSALRAVSPQNKALRSGKK